MDRSTWPSPLTGQTILVAEDEAFISFDIETMLNEAGANVMAAKDQRGGLLAAKCAELTAAVLDIKLGSDSVDPICGCLEQRSVPFLFLTGDSGRDVQKWAPAPIFSKPFDGSLLINGVLGLLITGGPLINQPPDSIALAEHLIFQAQMRVARQQGLIGGLTERGQDSGSAHELLRIMLKNLMQTYRQAIAGPELDCHHLWGETRVTPSASPRRVSALGQMRSSAPDAHDVSSSLVSGHSERRSRTAALGQ